MKPTVKNAAAMSRIAIFFTMAFFSLHFMALSKLVVECTRMVRNKVNLSRDEEVGKFFLNTSMGRSIRTMRD